MINLFLNRIIVSSKINFATFGSDNYSLVEKDTGFTWIDGRKIYKKTVNIGSLPSTGTKNAPHGITGIYEVMSIKGVGIQTANGVQIPLPNVATSLANMVEIYRNLNNIVIVTGGADRSNYTGYITLLYTKTT